MACQSLLGFFDAHGTLVEQVYRIVLFEQQLSGQATFTPCNIKRSEPCVTVEHLELLFEDLDTTRAACCHVLQLLLGGVDPGL